MLDRPELAEANRVVESGATLNDDLRTRVDLTIGKTRVHRYDRQRPNSTSTHGRNRTTQQRQRQFLSLPRR